MEYREVSQVGVVIVHYWNWPDLLATIGDVVRQGVQPDHIFVIDNGSPIGARTSALKMFAGINWRDDQGNVGYGAAVNIGARLVSARRLKYLMILTHEVRLGEGCIGSMVSRLALDSRIGAIGPLLNLKSRPSQVWSHGGTLDLATALPKLRVEWSSDPVDWVDGCCFIVRTEIFEKIGGMFEPYFLYMEEVDFFLRIRQLDLSVMVDEGAQAQQEPGEMGIYYATRNRILLARRLLPLRTTVFVVIETIGRLIHGFLTSPRQNRVKNLTRARALRDGIRMPIS